MGSVRDEISKNLLFHRKKKGYTQKQFAELVGVKNSAVSNWEKGVNCIDIETLVKACSVLDATIDDMFGIYALVGNEKAPPEILSLYSMLDAEDQSVVIRQIKGLLLDNKYHTKAKDA